MRHGYSQAPDVSVQAKSLMPSLAFDLILHTVPIGNVERLGKNATVCYLRRAQLSRLDYKGYSCEADYMKIN